MLRMSVYSFFLLIVINLKIAMALPSSIPLYPKAAILNETAGSAEAYMVVYDAKNTSIICNWYVSALKRKGWKTLSVKKEKSSSEISLDDKYVITAELKKSSLGINIEITREGTEYFIRYSWFAPP